MAAALCSEAEPGTEPPPGAVLGLAVGDQQWVVPYGDAVRTTGRVEPFRVDTRTDAGSVTKIISTTAACLRLVDSGRLELDARAAMIIDDRLPADITVGDLLEHQAGLWEWWPLYLRAADHDHALKLVTTLPRRYRRRSGRHYSDLGFMLLGALVEQLTGLPLDRACSALVLEPFGLAATRYAVPAGGAGVAASSNGDRIEQTMIATGDPYPIDGSVDSFTRWRHHLLVGEINDGNSFHAFGSIAGHAGIFTTAGDLLTFGRMLLDSLDGRGPVRAATVARFGTAGDDPGQALGFRIWNVAAGRAIGHTGFPGIGFAVLPEHDAVAVMITNRLHVAGRPRNLERLWTTVLDALPGLLPAPTAAPRQAAGSVPSRDPDSVDPGMSGSGIV
ncbi:serine hydrolase [Microlunatus sp. Gsoil 973]|uniref:serine hydrolase domain-containing protein n=1 Tax=Microlunatus sp. Gsoil 973 TaxID=2672569 RepID=UPI0018A82ED6|nr:serine hydrolase domain-containing protein [Microlunatus sp. Gsoil 973]